MGVTSKAFDINLRCPVTLKVINERYLGDESARLRFLREARAAASVRHPNVASVFHLGRTGENYFYAMEFVDGETLEKLIKRDVRLDVKVALEIVSQVAAGLAAVHEQNLVHRDIKPANIMVRLKEGGAVTLKIIDLGLAQPAADAPAETAISSPGAFAGIPEFASPEQFGGVVGPFYTDLAAYVFGDERPSPNAMMTPGIDVMPVDSWRGKCLNPASPESLHHQSQTQAQSGRRDSYDAEAPWTCQSLTA
jgi:serine/threonine protein kinase